MSPDRRQAIIWTNDGILLTGPLRTNFNHNTTIVIQEHALEHVVCKRRPFCPGLNETNAQTSYLHTNTDPYLNQLPLTFVSMVIGCRLQRTAISCLRFWDDNSNISIESKHLVSHPNICRTEKYQSGIDSRRKTTPGSLIVLSKSTIFNTSSATPCWTT